jgi:MOSC domain-containing protein YiiM
MTSGELEAIWVKPARGKAMDEVSSATLEAGAGIAGNADRGGRRQVTLIERERWSDALEELGAEVAPSARRANLMLAGVDLKESTGRVLRIGGCRLEIQGETAPCYRMDEAAEGLQEALRPDWRGGAYATVLDGGEIRVGQPARWEE